MKIEFAHYKGAAFPNGIPNALLTAAKSEEGFPLVFPQILARPEWARCGPWIQNRKRVGSAPPFHRDSIQRGSARLSPPDSVLTLFSGVRSFFFFFYFFPLPKPNQTELGHSCTFLIPHICLKWNFSCVNDASSFPLLAEHFHSK